MVRVVFAFVIVAVEVRVRDFVELGSLVSATSLILFPMVNVRRRQSLRFAHRTGLSVVSIIR